MTNKQFEKYYARYFVTERIIQRLARKLTRNNDQMIYEDLVQVGLITLWKLDPRKATANEDSWVRQAIKFRMIDWLRKEFPKEYSTESLDARLENGDQLEKDPESGLFVLREDVEPWKTLPLCNGRRREPTHGPDA